MKGVVVAAVIAMIVEQGGNAVPGRADIVSS